MWKLKKCKLVLVTSARRRRRVRRVFSFVAMLISLAVIIAKLFVHGPEMLLRFAPRTLREVQRALVNWDALLKVAQAEKKVSIVSSDLCVQVLSLERTSWRRQQTIHSLQSQGIPYEVFRAIDGLNSVDSNIIEKYAGDKKKKYLHVTTQWSQAQMVELYDAYESNKLRDRRIKMALHERLRFGVYMSHVTLWHRVINDRLPYLVILEDDVLVEREFLSSLFKLLRQLPENWGLLYLNGSYKKFGDKYGDGLFQSRGGVGLFGYAISFHAANFFLTKSALKSNRAIDLMMDNEVLTGRILAFHAFPPLVHIIDGMNSTLAY